MNCLKCENFWRTDIDECACDRCHLRATTTEESEDENNG